MDAPEMTTLAVQVPILGIGSLRVLFCAALPHVPQVMNLKNKIDYVENNVKQTSSSVIWTINSYSFSSKDEQMNCLLCQLYYLFLPSWWWCQPLSGVQLFVIPGTVAHQVLLSTEFSRQEYWSGQPFPSPRDLSKPGIEPRSPALQVDSLLSELLQFNTEPTLVPLNHSVPQQINWSRLPKADTLTFKCIAPLLLYMLLFPSKLVSTTPPCLLLWSQGQQ